MPVEIHGHCFYTKSIFNANTCRLVTPEILRCAQNDNSLGSAIFNLLRKEAAVFQSVDDFVLKFFVHLYLQYSPLDIRVDYLHVHIFKGFIYTLRAILAVDLALAGLAVIIGKFILKKHFIHSLRKCSITEH